jgi:hypothetical protein
LGGKMNCVAQRLKADRSALAKIIQKFNASGASKPIRKRNISIAA